jgi:ADP-heptose:LPS heptosyltransferase
MILSALIGRKPRHRDRIKQILLVKLDEIGDMATCSHVFRMLSEDFPSAELTVLCKPLVKNLIEFNPFVHRIAHEISELKGPYDAIVELRGNWQTFFYSIRHRPHCRVDRGSVRFRNRGNQKRETETNTEIVLPLLSKIYQADRSIYFEERSVARSNKFLREKGINKFVIIHAGARRVLRKWPVKRYAFLADFLFENGISTVVCGGPEDIQTFRDIADNAKAPVHEFIRDVSLSDFAAMCKNAEAFVGNESGPLHIADAQGLRCIALFGPGVPHVFYPTTPDSVALHKVLHCNPCDQIHCVHADNPCIERIEVSEVVEAVRKILLD